MAGGQPREGAEGAAGGAPALGRGPGPGARAALGFRRGDVVMTPRGRRAKVVGCVHGPGGSRLWAEYLSAFPPAIAISPSSPPLRGPAPPAPSGLAPPGHRSTLPVPSVPPDPLPLAPRTRAVPRCASASPPTPGRRFQMHETALLAGQAADVASGFPRRRTRRTARP